MSEENIDVNINTIVDQETLDQLNTDLTELEEKSVDVEVDTSGLDDVSQSADDAVEGVDELDESLNNVDGGGANEAADSVSNISTESNNAVGAVSDLTGVLGAIGGAVATAGVVAGLDSVASTADSAHLSTVGMQAALDLDDSGLQEVNSAITTIADNTPVSKGQIKQMWSAFGLGGIKSVGVLKDLTNDLTAFSVMSGQDLYTVGNSMSKAFISTTPQRAFRTLGISIDEVAAKAGMTTDAFKEAWAAATPEERAGMFDSYIKGTYDVMGINKELEDSYTTLKQNFDDKMGKLSTAFGMMVLPLIMPALTVLVDAFNWLGDTFLGLPDWAKSAIGIGMLGAAFALVGLILIATVVPAIASAILSLGGLFAAQGTTLISTGGLMGALSSSFFAFVAYVTGTDLATAASLGFTGALRAMLLAMVTNPIFLIVLAIIAIVVAIEKLGEYMGWWKDWGTMIDAFRAGIMRLWEAFINNKQVQAVIEWLKAAWQGVLDFLQPVFDIITSAWNSIFPPQDGGFDIVNSIINLFGWLGSVIGSLVAFVQANWPLILIAISPLIFPLRLIISVLMLVKAGFGTVVSYFQTGANIIVSAVNTLKSAWDNFASGVTGAYNTYIKPVIDAIQTGVGIASSFWNGITGNASGGAAGGYMSAAGGEDLQKIDYPEQNHYDIHLNGLVTEQSMIDFLLDLIEKGNKQDDMRT